MMWGWLVTADEAAELLDVTPARVRQMVEAGELTRVPSPGRATLLVRGQVERLTERRSRKGGRGVFVSPTLAEVPSPSSPRRLVYDRLTRLEVLWNGGEEVVHLRRWEGADGWSVVLLGTPGDGVEGHLINRSPVTIGAIERLLPDLDLERTAFVELASGLDSVGDAYTVHDSSVVVNPRTMGRGRLSAGRASLVTFERLVDALGERPVLWHRQAYRPELIERYQRLQEPIRDAWDPWEQRHRAQQIQALRECDHPDRELALDVLAVVARMVTQSGRPEPILRGAELDGRRYPWKPQGSYLEDIAIPDPVYSLAFERREGPGWPMDRETATSYRRRLVAFAEDTDPYHQEGAGELHDAVLAALGNLRPISGLGPQEMTKIEDQAPFPRSSVWTWSADDRDEVTSRYLASALASEGRDLTEAERTQLAARDGKRRELIGLGRDASGTAIGLERGREDLPDQVVALLPRRPNITLTATDGLVSGLIGVGHVPLYVERDGKILGVVTPPSETSQMNYGYGGGGPGASAHAIRVLLEASGFTLNDRALRAIAAFTEDPVWADGTHAGVQVGSLLHGTYRATPREG